MYHPKWYTWYTSCKSLQFNDLRCTKKRTTLYIGKVVHPPLETPPDGLAVRTIRTALGRGTSGTCRQSHVDREAVRLQVVA